MTGSSPRLRVVRDDVAKITPDELRRLRNLRNDAKALEMEADRIELAIMERIAAGERVESGALHASINRDGAPQVTEDDVRRLLGVDVLEEMRSRLDPVYPRTLKIRSVQALKPA